MGINSKGFMKSKYEMYLEMSDALKVKFLEKKLRDLVEVLEENENLNKMLKELKEIL